MERFWFTTMQRQRACHSTLLVQKRDKHSDRTKNRRQRQNEEHATTRDDNSLMRSNATEQQPNNTERAAKSAPGTITTIIYNAKQAPQ